MRFACPKLGLASVSDATSARASRYLGDSLQRILSQRESEYYKAEQEGATVENEKIATDFPLNTFVEGRNSPRTFYQCSGVDYAIGVVISPATASTRFIAIGSTRVTDFTRRLTQYVAIISAVLDASDGIYHRYPKIQIIQGDGFTMGGIGDFDNIVTGTTAPIIVRRPPTSRATLTLYNDPFHNSSIGQYDECWPTSDNWLAKATEPIHVAPSRAEKSSDTPASADVQRAGVACKALIGISTPKTGGDGLMHSTITCIEGFSGE